MCANCLHADVRKACTSNGHGKKTCATNVSVIVDLIPELVDALPLMYASLKCDLNLYPKAFDM